MNLNKDRFSQLIRGFQFRELLNELGWDNVKKKELILENDDKYELDAVAEKRNFVIFLCSSDKNGKIPNQNVRRKIDNRISKLYFEHLIIYTDSGKSQQIWQLVIREPNKPIIPREFVYYSTQYPEILLQKLSSLFFSIDEEEKISLPDVKARIQSQFNNNAEKVTKKFYERFSKELVSFQKFIEGIEDKIEKEWYASLMLNRLMFVYFIQKKGFLDNNNNYLHDKLKLTQKAKGKNKFYSFYKDFLLVLFHDGLGSPKRTKQLEQDLGKIPYLNGGLFEVHQLEEKNKKINIEDKAFEKIFSFFDEYNWHLDNCPTSSGKDINPDVIGYIFEKYINDRAAMGAYYTKEDITEYISKNTIIPFLFDEVKKECANAFRDESSLWKMLRENPDRYIYDAVKHGIYCHSESALADEESQRQIRPLPPEIQMGINPEIQKRIVKDVENNPPQLLELRKEWNKPAPEEFALPTEIWREVVERRSRYFDIRSKIESGEIKEINDFITYNLDIRQFAQDAVEQYEGSDFINAFYKSVTKISVLDPTCGSGAFLFAALNILEPIYETCISRMRGFIEEDDKLKGKKHPAFRDVIREINHHPNEKYFIYKSIILKNLFGVDIMNEATEIAKLRLFLKLVAEVEVDYKKDNLGLEPLPDIDFNIKCGNTLVGFAKADDVEKSIEGSFDATFLKDEIKKIKEEAELVSMAFQSYKDTQLIIEKNSEQHSTAKQELNNRLKSLNEKLNIYQARLYGIDPKKKKEYEAWKDSHQPFHWFAEFYEIINSGGFDVIIGNPPYIEYSVINRYYRVINYFTENCGNIYAYVLERSLKLATDLSRIGLIVPLSSVSTPRMSPVLNLYKQEKISSWLSFYAGDSNPSTLFTGVKSQLSIHLLNINRNNTPFILTTNYIRWYELARQNVFVGINYIPSITQNHLDFVYKIGSSIEKTIVAKIQAQQKPMSYFFLKSGENIFYYRNASGSYYRLFSTISPKIIVGKRTVQSSTLKTVNSTFDSNVVVSVFNSTLFHWLWTVVSDNYHITSKEFVEFKIDLDLIDKKLIHSLKRTNHKLMSDFESNSKYRTETDNRNNQIRNVQIFEPRNSKTIIDEIDKILADHYGFTEEELDFIINYDIKYRMGKELEEE